uniref:Uncharacterized protein n=1 Tax=Cucumis melo TaxID=3656 RepID=A0A9I9EGA6_CUCME
MSHLDPTSWIIIDYLIWAEEMSAFVLLKRGMKVAGTLLIEITRLSKNLNRKIKQDYGQAQYNIDQALQKDTSFRRWVLPQSIGAMKPYLRQLVDV